MNEFRLPLEYNWELAHKKIAKTEYYELDLATTNALSVSTIKGIVEVLGIQGPGEPGPSFSSGLTFYINNPKLLLTPANRDNIYMQYSIYYRPGPDCAYDPSPCVSNPDPTIPYVISKGIVIPEGVGFTIYNAGTIPGMTDEPWQGKFYLYFELYTK